MAEKALKKVEDQLNCSICLDVCTDPKMLVSGSGKSSLAFDTLYAEGQRRYIESLSSYARQFLGQLERPKVEHLRGLSPTIAIEQKSALQQPALDRRARSPRSTTTSGCSTRASACSTATCAASAGALAVAPRRSSTSWSSARERSPARVARAAGRPTARASSASSSSELKGRGYLRAERRRRDALASRIRRSSTRNSSTTIELVVDRVKVRKRERRRLTESVELALREGKGELRAESPDPDGPRLKYRSEFTRERRAAATRSPS